MEGKSIFKKYYLKALIFIIAAPKIVPAAWITYGFTWAIPGYLPKFWTDFVFSRIPTFKDLLFLSIMYSIVISVVIWLWKKHSSKIREIWSRIKIKEWAVKE